MPKVDLKSISNLEIDENGNLIMDQDEYSKSMTDFDESDNYDAVMALEKLKESTNSDEWETGYFYLGNRVFEDERDRGAEEFHISVKDSFVNIMYIDIHSVKTIENIKLGGERNSFIEVQSSSDETTLVNKMEAQIFGIGDFSFLKYGTWFVSFTKIPYDFDDWQEWERQQWYNANMHLITSSTPEGYQPDKMGRDKKIGKDTILKQYMPTTMEIISINGFKTMAKKSLFLCKGSPFRKVSKINNITLALPTHTAINKIIAKGKYTGRLTKYEEVLFDPDAETKILPFPMHPVNVDPLQIKMLPVWKSNLVLPFDIIEQFLNGASLKPTLKNVYGSYWKPMKGKEGQKVRVKSLPVQVETFKVKGGIWDYNENGEPIQDHEGTFNVGNASKEFHKQENLYGWYDFWRTTKPPWNPEGGLKFYGTVGGPSKVGQNYCYTLDNFKTFHNDIAGRSKDNGEAPNVASDAYILWNNVDILDSQKYKLMTYAEKGGGQLLASYDSKSGWTVRSNKLILTNGITGAEHTINDLEYMYGIRIKIEDTPRGILLEYQDGTIEPINNAIIVKAKVRIQERLNGSWRNRPIHNSRFWAVVGDKRLTPEFDDQWNILEVGHKAQFKDFMIGNLEYTNALKVWYSAGKNVHSDRGAIIDSYGRGRLINLGVQRYNAGPTWAGNMSREEFHIWSQWMNPEDFEVEYGVGGNVQDAYQLIKVLQERTFDYMGGFQNKGLKADWTPIPEEEPNYINNQMKIQNQFNSVANQRADDANEMFINQFFSTFDKKWEGNGDLKPEEIMEKQAIANKNKGLVLQFVAMFNEGIISKYNISSGGNTQGFNYLPYGLVSQVQPTIGYVAGESEAGALYDGTNYWIYEKKTAPDKESSLGGYPDKYNKGNISNDTAVGVKATMISKYFAISGIDRIDDIIIEDPKNPNNTTIMKNKRWIAESVSGMIRDFNGNYSVQDGQFIHNWIDLPSTIDEVDISSFPGEIDFSRDDYSKHMFLIPYKEYVDGSLIGGDGNLKAIWDKNEILGASAQIEAPGIIEDALEISIEYTNGLEFLVITKDLTTDQVYPRVGGGYFGVKNTKEFIEINLENNADYFEYYTLDGKQFYGGPEQAIPSEIGSFHFEFIVKLREDGILFSFPNQSEAIIGGAKIGGRFQIINSQNGNIVEFKNFDPTEKNVLPNLSYKTKEYNNTLENLKRIYGNTDYRPVGDILFTKSKFKNFVEVILKNIINKITLTPRLSLRKDETETFLETIQQIIFKGIWGGDCDLTIDAQLKSDYDLKFIVGNHTPTQNKFFIETFNIDWLRILKAKENLEEDISLKILISLLHPNADLTTFHEWDLKFDKIVLPTDNERNNGEEGTGRIWFDLQVEEFNEFLQSLDFDDGGIDSMNMSLSFEQVPIESSGSNIDYGIGLIRIIGYENEFDSTIQVYNSNTANYGNDKVVAKLQFPSYALNIDTETKTSVERYYAFGTKIEGFGGEFEISEKDTWISPDSSMEIDSYQKVDTIHMLPLLNEKDDTVATTTFVLS